MAGPYGPVPEGWGTDPGGPGEFGQRGRGVLIALAGLTLVALLVLVWLFTRDGGEDTGAPAGPPLPEPTLALERGGFRYSIGVGPFTPAVDAAGTRPIPPGRHVLTAVVVIRNDTDRPAPALITSDGAAPRLRAGLAGIDWLPPVHSLGLPRMVSDCVNDDRNPRVFTGPGERYTAIPDPTCIVEATTRPAAPAPTGISDRTIAPGAVSQGVVTTIDLPVSVAPDRASVWLATSTDADGTVEFTRIP